MCKLKITNKQLMLTSRKVNYYAFTNIYMFEWLILDFIPSYKVSDEASNEFSDKASNEVSDEASDEVSDEASDEVSDESSDEVSDEASNLVCRCRWSWN